MPKIESGYYVDQSGEQWFCAQIDGTIHCVHPLYLTWACPVTFRRWGWKPAPK